MQYLFLECTDRRYGHREYEYGINTLEVSGPALPKAIYSKTVSQEEKCVGEIVNILDDLYLGKHYLKTISCCKDEEPTTAAHRQSVSLL